ncbi:DUF192 domain-containing protein [Hoeflea sp. EC-HK425]|jgi:hypothetical protein|uniref:DUF192 domain-containing protein n=1 Tax=Hoeflea sp. EC-HK425 TaxID=2038388 RepID=UPI001255151E|nr:DUF192 domain-containing protein [Hoeflea sp. EC-HK425]VVT12619.1 conserved hypothetical protein [Hoeflea sp. EC-HK425]|tara:strand:+ start:1068 stop:1535 length:468 start_codon:yes stop_codon:yes gene_type:complete
MRHFKQVAAFLIFLVLSFGPGALVAGPLPVDSERLFIDTSKGPVGFTVELALTPENRATGLMNRQSMAADHGMLFRFDQTRDVLMWMKNTPLSLDMLFIAENGRIARIAENTVPYSETIIPSGSPVRYVLELNAGTAAKTGVSVGDRVRHRVIGN